MTSPGAMVNGQRHPMDGVGSHTSALDWLRSRGLTGAKEGCAEGECGACAILVARPDGAGRSQWTAVNSCLVPALALDGQELVTSEGLASSAGLHPVQHEMAVRGGSQCGYCTPGFVCSMAAEYYRPGRGAPAEADTPELGPNGFDLHSLSGNLCRCTGYRPIRDAAYALGPPAADDALAARLSREAPAPVATRSGPPTGAYARARDLDDAFGLLADHPGAVVVAGATDWGVEVNLRAARAPFVIAIDRVPELRGLEVRDDTVEIGAALTLSELEAALAAPAQGGRDPAAPLPGASVPLLAAVLPQFASRLIRNAATIGGNLATASPIGDLPPALLALEARVVLSSANGDRTVPIGEYFTGYRTTARRADELIRSVQVPLPLAPLTAFHKIAKRRFDDISSVAVAFALTVSDGRVARARIGLGGVAATPIRAHATESALEGRPWNAETARDAAAVMRDEGTPLDDHRASAAYRAAMLGTALLRLHADGEARAQRVSDGVGR